MLHAFIYYIAYIPVITRINLSIPSITTQLAIFPRIKNLYTSSPSFTTRTCIIIEYVNKVTDYLVYLIHDIEDCTSEMSIYVSHKCECEDLVMNGRLIIRITESITTPHIDIDTP